MHEALDAAERATEVARGLDGWALAILLIAALVATVVYLARALLTSLREQIAQNLQIGSALSRSAEAHERTTRALAQLQASAERLSADVRRFGDAARGGRG